VKDEGLVERKFLASLHRAIEDIAPEQLEVFEKWFDPADRRTRFHIAPVIGALGYLRKTPSFYQEVMRKAGGYASQWYCSDIPQLKRKVMLSKLPLGRKRLMRNLLRGSLRSIHRDGELAVDRNGDRLILTLENSLFCRTNGHTATEPTCFYYASFFEGLLTFTHEGCSTVVESHCRGRGDAVCTFEAILEVAA
jgi:predicted hydrocarbon binding protein